MQDIQEQQEAIKKSLVPPIKPTAKNIKFCRQCLYLPKKKMLVLGLQGCLYHRYKVLVLGLQNACSATENNITLIHDRLHDVRKASKNHFLFYHRQALKNTKNNH